MTPISIEKQFCLLLGEEKVAKKLKLGIYNIFKSVYVLKFPLFNNLSIMFETFLNVEKCQTYDEI